MNQALSHVLVLSLIDVIVCGEIPVDFATGRPSPARRPWHSPSVTLGIQPFSTDHVHRHRCRCVLRCFVSYLASETIATDSIFVSRVISL